MNNYELTKNIAQLFIQNLQLKQNLSAKDIRQQVETACQSAGVEELSSEEINKLVKELESQYQTVIGTERELLGDDEGWEAWLPTRRAAIEWSYWNRYRTYLSQESFPDDVLARLESSTDRVLGLMGDPNREGSWDRRGLVVGLVQSGKTAHYVGVINKAVDSGYKVIVVLTGFTESLRIQTQDRLEKGVLGYSQRPDPRDSRRVIAVPCGVALISPIRQRMDSVTTRKDDFKTGIAKNFAIHVGGNSIVFVIKKNVSVLKNLLQWVTNFGNEKDAEGNSYVSGIPLLVIDDESDVGSIDTKKGAVDALGDVNDEHDPTKINKQIRKLISLFEQSSYVGYTATPFANVLIHDQKKTGVDKEDGLLIGEDLFPRSFIVSLPTPSNHVGPAMIFGSTLDNEESLDGLPVIREVSDTQLGEDKSDYWMPSSHRKTHVPFYLGQERIPDSLRKAMLSFILVIAARRLRGDDDKHNSMLVHVTRFTDVQHEVYEQIERELQDVVHRLRDKTANGKLLEELRFHWEGDEKSFHETTIVLNQRPEAIFQNPVHSWAEIHGELLEAVSSIEVRKINGTARDVLDYDENHSGLNVIAIGGDKLARGLTLEGLSVSYFLRCSKMYDTLMQMGRWFGYRPGYLDLCRLYTTEELSGWFSHIADATDELRDEFKLMADSGCTPKEFGLKVRSHPTMMVTSAVKMRDGKPLQISFQGTMAQTIDFSRTEKSVTGNWAAAETIVNRAEQDFGISPSSPRSNAAMWSGVPGELVANFLEGYRVHSAARTVKTPLLKKYLESQMKKGGLRSWTVLLSGGGAKDSMANLGETAQVRCSDRNWFLQGTTREELINADHYRIKVLISPSDELVDLGPGEEEAALTMDIKDWKANDGIRRGRKVDLPTKPNGRFVRQVKHPSRGLLILYPLLPDDEKAQNESTPILGFAISFPAVSSLGDTPITYIVGNIYQQQDLESHD
jgi:hypothetical protein